MKRYILIVLGSIVVSSIYSQTNRFNQYYDSITPHKGNEFSSVIETDSGYTAFNCYSFAVHYIDSMGNLISTKSFLDTNNYHNNNWTYNNSLDLFENNESEKYYIQASGTEIMEYDSTLTTAYHLVKYNNMFDTVWSREICEANSSIQNLEDDYAGQLYDCVIGNEGNIYSTGYGFKLLGDSMFTEYGNIIYMVADSLGNPIQLQNFPFISVNEISYGSRIIETFNNKILIGGNLDFFPQGTHPSPKGYLLNINKDGSLNWKKTEYKMILWDAIQLNDSGFVYGGVRYMIWNNEPYGAAALVKLDNNGNTIWERDIGFGFLGNGNYVSYQVKNVIENEDSSIICAISRFDLSIEGYHIMIYKFSKDGEIIWKRTLDPDLMSMPNPAFNMRPYDLRIANDGGYIVSGYMNKVGLTTPFLIKTDQNGCDGLFSCMDTTTMMYLQTWEDSVCNGDSVLVSIAISNGHAPYTGIINGTDTIDEPLYLMPDTSSYFFYAHPTLSDTYVHVTIEDQFGYQYSNYLQFNVVDCNISIDEILPEVTFKIFPNPANSFIQIDVFKGKYLKKQIEIYNQQGQLIYSKPDFDSDTGIDISSFVNGVYTIKLITEKGIGIEKFVKI